MAQREVYKIAPLRLVALDFRFPVTARLLSRKVWEAFEDCLGRQLPLVETMITGDPDQHIPGDPKEPLVRRLSAGRSRAVTLYAGGITVEVGDYVSFTDLKDLTLATLRGAEVIPGNVTATSVGLRYVNEVLASMVLSEGRGWQRAKSWKPFINADLLREIRTKPPGLWPFVEHGELWFHNRNEDKPGWVNLSYGIHHDGVVSPVGVLTLEDKPGPCFVLDIDSNRYAGDDGPVGSGTSALMDVVDDLHMQVEATFDWAITDTLREVFRGDVSADSPRAVGA